MFYCFVFLDYTELQKLTKESLEIQWSNPVSCDWLRDPKGFLLDQLYTELVWKKMIKGAMTVTQEPMKNIYSIFDDAAENVGKATNVLVEGKI